jgi:uncharacterized membrane protein
MKKQEVKEMITSWFQSGYISQEQADYMKSDLDKRTSENSGKKFISAIMYIGAIALSLGALLLIASNWSGLSKTVKLILTILLPVAPISFAYWKIIVKDQAEYVLGRAANLLGMFLVGGSLAMIGQLYNLESNLTSFFWTWTLLTFPFIFVFKKGENALFSSAIVGVSIAVSMVRFFEMNNMDEGSIVIMYTCVALIYAAALYAIGLLLRQSKNWIQTGSLLRKGGGSVALITLFITTFEFYARMIVGGTYRNPGNWEVLSIAFNVFFIGFMVFVLVRSIKFEEYDYAFSVVRLFGIYLFVKYITLFYSMLDTGLFFIIGGIIFITGGLFLEKKKDFIFSYMGYNKLESHE